MVRKGGLEPPCLSAPPPQDGVSANSTTSAGWSSSGSESSCRSYVANRMKTSVVSGFKRLSTKLLDGFCLNSLYTLACCCFNMERRQLLLNPSTRGGEN